MLTTRNHYLTANLGNVYLFTRSLQVDEDGYPRRPGTVQCAAYGRQLLQSIAQNWRDDALNHRLWKLWLDFFQTAWDQPTDLDAVIDDLAEAIGRGDLRVYLEYNPTEEGLRQQMAEKAAATESKTPAGDTSREEPEQPRTRKSVERPPQDSNTGPAAGAIPRAPAAEPDPVQERQERYEERKQLVSETAENPGVQEANERLAFNNDNIIRAEAASYVYDVDRYNRGHISELPDPPTGLNRIDPETVKGLGNATFTSKESGFGAALFESEINGETMLTFKGTNMNTEETFWQDWGANLGQGIGKETQQYNQAMFLVKRARMSELGNNFSVVGHSLGGGLTSAGVSVSGQRGYTFNSAGLHPDTAARESGMSNEEAAKLLETQSVEGDALTMFQKYGGYASSAVGASLGGWAGSALTGGAGGHIGAALGAMLAPNPPEALGNHRSLPSVEGGSAIDRHSMDQVVAGIEHQKEQDIKTLQQLE